jgi:hypothetical protein
MKRAAAAFSLALMVVPFLGSAASAQDPTTIADSQIVDRALCLFRTYVNEGGENGFDCLS